MDPHRCSYRVSLHEEGSKDHCDKITRFSGYEAQTHIYIDILYTACERQSQGIYIILFVSFIGTN